MSEQYYPQDNAFDESNLPDRSVLRENRDPHKSTFDLEDVTGNPGHRGANPNIPAATAEEIAERLAAGVESINEPPWRQFAAAAVEVAPQTEELPPHLGPYSINEPPGPEATPEPPEGEAPTLSSIEPNISPVGGPDIEMHAYGTGFTAASIITFNGGDEPTTFVSDTDIYTTVKPSTAGVMGAFPVTVRNGAQESAAVDFTFTE